MSLGLELRGHYPHTFFYKSEVVFKKQSPSVCPGEGSKEHISFNFNYKVNFKDFFTKFCVCFHK